MRYDIILTNRRQLLLVKMHWRESSKLSNNGSDLFGL